MNDLLLRACRGESVERTPLWIMRQAGRYLPEYREVRTRVDFPTLCRTPELATEVTLQPLRRFDLDAAIVFSDILVLAEPMGLEVAFNPGPVLERPVRDGAAIDALREDDPERTLAYVMETIRNLRGELEVPLLGFAAAPLTLAAYLVEGHGSKNFEHLKNLVYGDPKTAHRLLEKIARLTARYVRAQVDAGAQGIQLFDTWAGLFDPTVYREFGVRWARHVFDELGDRVPRIYFAMNSAHLLEEIPACGADVVAVDWRVPLGEASRRLGGRTVLQGNLDPCALLAGPEVVEAGARRVLDEARELPGHIFNLGHGILPGTPIESVERLVETVRRSG